MRWLSLCFAWSALACGSNAPEPPPTVSAADRAAVEDAIPYRLDYPDAVMELPDALAEVSGLTALGPDRLAAVQDEDGIVYVLDAATGAVVSEHRFASDGDYEGVEAVGEAVWVLKSNGNLYETSLDGPSPESTVYRTPLRASCDAEGLGYDATAGRLLIACKEDPGVERPGVRAVYAFPLSERQLVPQPLHLLDRAPLDADGQAFKPSALAVRPQTGERYVLSSVRRALAVFGTDGAFVAALALPGTRFPQPEGIAFLPDGTLLITNEGAGGTPTLLRFSEVTP